jgi:hypothetical protein
MRFKPEHAPGHWRSSSASGRRFDQSLANHWTDPASDVASRRRSDSGIRDRVDSSDLGGFGCLHLAVRLGFGATGRPTADPRRYQTPSWPGSSLSCLPRMAGAAGSGGNGNAAALAQRRPENGPASRGRDGLCGLRSQPQESDAGDHGGSHPLAPSRCLSVRACSSELSTS